MFARLIRIALPLLLSMFLGQAAYCSTAVVVFGGQIVGVDLTQGRVTRRLKYPDRLRSTACASLASSSYILTVAGEDLDGAGWSLLSIDARTFIIRKMARLQEEPTAFVTIGQPVLPKSPGSSLLLLSGIPSGDSVYARGLILLDANSLKVERRVTILPDKKACPNEQIEFFALTPDQEHVIAITTGGLNEQSRLHLLSWPTLNVEKVIPLLDILDDVPVTVVFIP